MKKIRAILHSLFSIIAACCLLGCASLQPAGPAIAERAGFRITQQVLKRHPDWRPEFERARNELVNLQSQPKLDALAVIEILDRLPELEATDAWIITDVATISILVAGDPALKPESEAQLRAAVAGLVKGMDRVLSPP